MEQKNRRRAKALVLLSGGLDSILAAKMILEQGICVEGIHLTDPFSSVSGSAEKAAEQLGIRLHSVPRGRELLEAVRKPVHGYGSQANPCIDCRILSLRKAWKFAKKRGFDFLVTGEVLGQRPMSQRMPELMLIEKEAGLVGKVLRPLSAKLLPETEAEKRGWIDRSRLLDMQGRQRKRQIALAKEYGIRDYPSPAGGCLLTDKEFSRKLLHFLEHRKNIADTDIGLLKLGRHFRVGKTWIIVGRNENENKALFALSKKMKPMPAVLEAEGFVGPSTLVLNPASASLRIAAQLTVRYSDAPAGKLAEIRVKNNKKRIVLRARALPEGRITKLRA